MRWPPISTSTCRDHLLTREIEPAGVDTVVGACLLSLDQLLAVGNRAKGVVHLLVDLRKSDLEVRAVRQVAVAADDAGHTATEIGLSVERLLNALKSEVGMATVSHLPERDLRVTRQVHVLRAVSDKLHQASSHVIILAKKKISRLSVLNALGAADLLNIEVFLDEAL